MNRSGLNMIMVVCLITTQFAVALLQRMRGSSVFPCCVILLVSMIVWQQIAGHGTEKHVSDILKARIEMAKELWADLLQALDDDNDEKIEKREYVAAAERRFSQLWSQFDDDGDGNYTRGEWEDIYLQEAFDPDCSRSIFTCSNKTGVDGEAVNVSQHLIISIGRHVNNVR